jgi:hypothetical protein
MGITRRLILLAFSVASLALEAQISLPAPTGPFSVGRSVFFWTNESRREEAVPGANKPRELAAFVYYPAEAGSMFAEYFPGLAGLASAPETKMLQLQFGSAWQTVASGSVRSHAYPDPPFVRGREKFPLLMFSPGIGVPVLAYTAQLEELASRGYVVVAIEHGNDAALIIKPDHALIPFVTPALDAGPPTAAGLEVYRAIAIRWTADTKFALDEIVQLSHKRGTKFFGRLNLSQIGIFGHSVGGESSARLCQMDSRVRACLNEDGEIFGIPFGGSEPVSSVIPDQPMKASFVDIFVPDPMPDSALAAVHVTRKQFEDWRNSKTQALRTFLHANTVPSYLITVRRPGYIHGSFIDIRLLRATIAGTDAPQDASNLKLGTAFPQAFFDATLKNQGADWKQLVSNPAEGVTVESFGARR